MAGDNKGIGKIIGILKTGEVPDELQSSYGNLEGLFQKFIGLANATLKTRTYDVVEGDLPQSINECDGWLITGSRHGVYDGYEWIQKLMTFSRQVVEGGVPIIGICFGHQLLAEAMGGKVEKSEKGWGVGTHDYDIINHEDWMTPAPEGFSMNVMHQDQIIALPPHAKTIAQSDFCPHAAVIYSDNAISFQGHPEFNDDYEKALIDFRKDSTIPTPVAEKGLESISGRQDSTLIGKWINRFLENSWR